MAMFLKLEASSVANTKIQSTPGIPDFMDWNQITALPWFWQPFKSPAVHADRRRGGAGAPGLRDLSFAMFKRRVGGVYFAIITQAIAAILTILIVGQQGYTGGINGITDLRTLLGWDIRTDHAKFDPVLRQCAACCSPASWSRAASSRRQARPHPGRHARQGGPGPLLRLRRRQLQDLRLLPRRGAARRSAARCSRCRSASCRPPSSASCPSIEMVIFCAVGGRSRSSARSRHAARQLWPRPTSPRAFRSSGCSGWAACSSPWCWPSRTASPV